MDTFTQNTYTNYYNKISLNTKTKAELIDLYINDFNIKPNTQAKLLTKIKIKTKDDIIKLILTQSDLQYTKLIKKTYGNHKDEYTELCNNFTTGELNDETKAVRDRIHAIHDFIRNKGFGYGMTGLKLFNLFYGLLQIEKSGLLQKWTFSDETLNNTKLSNEDLIKKMSFNAIFDYVNTYDEVKDKETGKSQTISKLISELCELLRYFSKGNDSKLKNLIYYDLSHIIADAIDIKTLLKLIKELDELTDSSNIQLGGKIYEYFVGRDQSAISELGAYFTDRHLVNYIFDNILNINNTVDIDNLPKVCDMFGGSGGFTINFIVYVNSILNDKGYSNNDIYKYWKGKNIKNINHFDVNQDVVNNAKLEAFCLTHQLIDKNSFNTSNSFTESYTDNTKYNLIISNPPYGGDKTHETSKMKEYNTIIEYNKNLLYNDFDKDMTPEQRSKLLIQNTLLDEEIKHIKLEQKKKCINYSSCSNFIREYCDKITDFENEYIKSLANNKKSLKKVGEGFNDKESCSFVLLMALCAKGGRVLGVLKEGVFFDSKYTHIRRYLLNHFIVKRVDSNPCDAFENTTTKTSNILFELPEDGSVPDDYIVNFYDVNVIKNTENVFNTNNDYTLLNSASNGTINTVEPINEKKVSVKTILDNVECSLNSKQYDNKPLTPGKGFTMVKLGDACEFLPKSRRNASFSNDIGTYPFYTSSEIVKRCNIADYNTKSIIIGTHGNISIHITNNKYSCTSNTLPFITKKYNINYIYYLLKLLLKSMSNDMNGSVINFISKKYLQDLELPIPDTDEQLQYWVNYISDPYNKIQDTRTRLTTLETQVKTDIQTILDNNECEEVMLGDLCEYIKTGSHIKDRNGTTYPYYGTSKIICYLNTYLFEGKHISIARKGDCIINLLDGKFTSNDDTVLLKLNNLNTLILFYILINNKLLFQYNGSTVKGVKKTDIEKLKIQLPKDRSVLDTLNPLFDEIDKLNEELPKYEELYKSRLEELRTNAIQE